MKVNRGGIQAYNKAYWKLSHLGKLSPQDGQRETVAAAAAEVNQTQAEDAPLVERRPAMKKLKATIEDDIGHSDDRKIPWLNAEPWHPCKGWEEKEWEAMKCPNPLPRKREAMQRKGPEQLSEAEAKAKETITDPTVEARRSCIQITDKGCSTAPEKEGQKNEDAAHSRQVELWQNAVRRSSPAGVLSTARLHSAPAGEQP